MSTSDSSVDVSDRLVGRNFLALGSGEAAARIVAFVATVYLARVLGSEAFGVVGFATAVILYLKRVADGGIELGVGVQMIADHPDRVEELGGALVTARLLVAAVLVVGLVVVGLLVVPPPDGPVLAAFGLTLLAVGAGTRWIHFGLERTGMVAVARTVGEIAMVALVLLTVHGPDDLVTVPLAQFVGDAAAALLMLVVLRRWGHRISLRVDLEAVREVLPRCWPLVAGSLLSLLIYNSDLIFLRFFRGASAVGYYVAAYALVSFLVNLSSAYGSSLLPTLSRLDGDDEQRLYRTATAQALTVALPVAVGGALLAPGIIGRVFGQAYAPAVLPLQILLFSVVFGVLRDVPTVALMSRGREDRLLRMNAVATGVNLLLNLAVIPVWGIVGAAWATVATEAVRMSIGRRFARDAAFAPPPVSRFWRAIVATAAMVAVLLGLGLDNPWIGIPAGAAAYGAVLAATGGLSVREGRVALDV